MLLLLLLLLLLLPLPLQPSGCRTYPTTTAPAGECWQQPRDLGDFLSAQTEESCTQYNVLKVARQIFLWEAEPSLADFYEQALWNGIIGNQRREGPPGQPTAG